MGGLDGWMDGWMDPAEKPSPLRAPAVLKNSILRKSFANGEGHLVFIPLFFFKDFKGRIWRKNRLS